jgi:hypothetical protein
MSEYQTAVPFNCPKSRDGLLRGLCIAGPRLLDQATAKIWAWALCLDDGNGLQPNRDGIRDVLNRMLVEHAIYLSNLEKWMLNHFSIDEPGFGMAADQREQRATYFAARRAEARLLGKVPPATWAETGLSDQEHEIWLSLPKLPDVRTGSSDSYETGLNC